MQVCKYKIFHPSGKRLTLLNSQLTLAVNVCKRIALEYADPNLLNCFGFIGLVLVERINVDRIGFMIFLLPFQDIQKQSSGCVM